jgi:hypothetical protein
MDRFSDRQHWIFRFFVGEYWEKSLAELWRMVNENDALHVLLILWSCFILVLLRKDLRDKVSFNYS